MEKAYAQSPGEKYQYDESVIEKKEDALVVPLRPFEKSSLGLRMMAFTLDQAILIIPSIIFAGVFSGFCFVALSGVINNTEFIKAMSVGGSIASFFGIHWLYFSLCESSKKQATFGMSILGIKVSKQDGTGLSFFEANNRYWTWFFSTLFFGINFLGFLGEEKDFFHDKIAGSQVVIDS